MISFWIKGDHERARLAIKAHGFRAVYVRTLYNAKGEPVSLFVTRSYNGSRVASWALAERVNGDCNAAPQGALLVWG